MSKPCYHCGAGVPDEVMRVSLRSSGMRAALHLLVENEGRVVPHGKFPCSRKSLPVFVCEIREALRDEGVPWRISNVYGEGYMLRRSA